MQIFPTVTTITPGKWREKLAEVKKLKLREVCLFLTCLDKKEREEFYLLLKETSVERVPFVHMKNDMPPEELAFLIKTYKTEVFSTHSEKEFPLFYDCSRYKKVICIENTYEPLDEAEIKEFGGVCLDLSHLESDRILRPDVYRTNVEVLKKYPPKCSHISVIKKEAVFNEKSQKRMTTHCLKDLSELDYLKRYSMEYFGEIAAIELENTIEEQLKAKEYISILIKDKGGISGY